MTLTGKTVTLPKGVVGVVGEPSSEWTHWVHLDTGFTTQIMDRVLLELPVTYRRVSL